MIKIQKCEQTQRIKLKLCTSFGVYKCLVFFRKAAYALLPIHCIALLSILHSTKYNISNTLLIFIQTTES